MYYIALVQSIFALINFEVLKKKSVLILMIKQFKSIIFSNYFNYFTT